MEPYLLIFNWMDIRNPKAGGQEKYCYEMAKRLTRDGLRVVWIASGFRGGDKKEIYDGIEILRVGSIYTVYVLSFFTYIKLRKARYVLISINAIPFIAPFHRKRRLVMLHHRIDYKTMKEKIGLLGIVSLVLQDRINPILYRKDHIITVSNSSKEDFESIGYKNISVVKLGVNNPALDLRSKTELVVSPGPVKPWKHHDLALRAFSRMEEKWKIAIFGSFESKEYENQLKELAEQLGIAGRVKFYGRVDESQLADIYRQAKICILATEKEGWGLTAMEAQSYGSPVVGFDVPGLRDSVKNGITGILVPYGDVSALGNALVELSMNEKLLTQMSYRAVERAKEYDWEICYEEFKEKISELEFNEEKGHRKQDHPL
ncbi:MAG: glycosyltransferase family 4 protein [Candidatus Parvarchaeota archaeon]